MVARESECIFLIIERCYFSCLNLRATMRTTLALDDELVAKAQAFTGVTEKAEDEEVLGFFEMHGLQDIGLVEANLLASVSLAAPARFWTRDKLLKAVADRLGLLAPGRN
jgi:hypothetical protein